MTTTVRLLNQLLMMHHRSFATYLADADPVHQRGGLDDDADRTLRNIILGHRRISARIAEAILDRHGDLDLGSYPMEFTDKNFLSLDYLARELLEYQRRDVPAIRRIVAGLERCDDVEACELAQEALGEATAHLEALETLIAKQPV